MASDRQPLGLRKWNSRILPGQPASVSPDRRDMDFLRLVLTTGAAASIFSLKVEFAQATTTAEPDTNSEIFSTVMIGGWR